MRKKIIYERKTIAVTYKLPATDLLLNRFQKPCIKAQQMLPFKSSNILLFLILSAGLLAAGAFVYMKNRRKAPELPTLTTNSNTSQGLATTNFFFDLETTEGLSNTDNIKKGIAHSGQMACDLGGGKEFGISVIKRLSDAGTFPLKRTGASIWVYPLSEGCNVVLTASISNSKNETVFWDGKSTERMDLPANKWTKINALYNFPVEKLSSDDVLQINIWNKGKTDVIVDDLEVVYGENTERRGEYPGIDANLFYENRFSATRNKAPFPTICFKKQQLNNNDSTLLINENPLFDFAPADEYIVGDFMEDKLNLDELLYIKNGKTLFFLRYDEENQGFQVFHEMGVSNHPLGNRDATKFAGDFNSNGASDVLIIHANDWLLFEFKNDRWVQLSKGHYDKLNLNWNQQNVHPFVSNLFTNNKNDALVFMDSGYYHTLQFNKASGTLEEANAAISKADSGLFNSKTRIYHGDFTGRGRQEFLKYDTEWRFDLKLMEKDATGYTIISTVDFSGYKNDYNPKYYEHLKIIPGRFSSAKKTSVIAIMRNCADSNFNGTNCNVFENLDYLPNSIQLYTIGEACIW